MEKLYGASFWRYNALNDEWEPISIGCPVWTMSTDKKAVIDTAIRVYRYNWDYSYAIVVERPQDNIRFIRVRQGWGASFRLFDLKNSSKNV